MSDSNAEMNKAIVLEAFDTLFNRASGIEAFIDERERLSAMRRRA